MTAINRLIRFTNRYYYDIKTSVHSSTFSFLADIMLMKRIRRLTNVSRRYGTIHAHYFDSTVKLTVWTASGTT
jgi:hypothetical protein